MLKRMLVVVVLLVMAPAVYAQGPDGDDYTWELVADGFERPLLVMEPEDGTGRLFVVEQQGYIYVVADGQVLDEPFLDLTDVTAITANERGLLGLAFHPNFAQNGYFFVNYTHQRDGRTVVSRFEVSPDDPDQADRASETIIIEIDQPYGNHNGGMIVFGPDGYLYIGMGDGGAAGDPDGNGQDLGTLLGTLLRIDVDSEAPYAIPDDNPFAGDADAQPEIWSYGLRNPWRFSFDMVTGDLYIGDVGQNEYEEIHFQPADSPGGENYGWNVFEGLHFFRQGGLELEDAVFPVIEYSHSSGGCSVTGGYVYRGAALPALDGVYFYGDYCSGKIWSLQQDDNDEWISDLFMDTNLAISSFGQDQNGELYLIDQNGGIYRLGAND